VNRWKEMTYEPSIKQCWRIYPHQLDTVGFFLARVVKGS
jgi:16S rRNA C967 or C1407 C5-methylase (RsmB/RsmF family)